MGEEQGPVSPIVPHPYPIWGCAGCLDLAMTSDYHTDILFYGDDKSLDNWTFVLIHIGDSLGANQGRAISNPMSANRIANQA